MLRHLGSLAGMLLCAGDLSAAPPAAPACAAPEYRQFDFWLGDWEVYESAAPGTRVARVQVEPVLKGCGVLEIYAGEDGHEGRSFSIYDATRRLWHQTWITNRGQLLLIEGGFKSGSMQLEGADLAAYGARTRLVRGTWEPTGTGVREVAQRSLDGGKTWQPWFDLQFRRHVGQGRP